MFEIAYREPTVSAVLYDVVDVVQVSTPAAIRARPADVAGRPNLIF